MKKHFSFILLLALMLSVFSMGYALTVQIGDGTATTKYFPIDGWFHFSYSQQIYTQSQINYAGDITKIRFYYASGSLTNSQEWRIYLGHTQKTEFTSTSDWETPADLTEVYDGDVSSMLPTPGNWMEITLTTPFNYNNSDNLIVAVHQYTPGYTSSYLYCGAFTSGTNTGMYYRNDSTDFDINDPGAAYSTMYSDINRIQFVFPDTAAPEAPQLLYPENDGLTFAGQSLRWAQPAGSADATGYDVYIDGTMVSNNQTANTYLLTEAVDIGTHNWYVIARNELGVSPASETWSFEYVNAVIIGTGTSSQRYPFNCYYGYTRSLGLYTAEQIGQTGILNTLGWSVATSGTGAIPYKIYVKPTTDTAIAQMSWADFTAGATLVKDGTNTRYTFGSTGWHQFTLDTPFTYTGNNLLIGVEANWGGSGSTSAQSPQFHYSTGGTGSHRYWSSNSGNGYASTSLPNILMLMSPIPNDPVFTISPTEHNFGSMLINTTSGQTFTITNTGGGTLDVTGISPMYDGFFTVTNANISAPLGTGQTASFDIQYAPTAAGTHSATFTISHTNGTTDVTVSGECYDPTIRDFPWIEGFTATAFPPANWTRLTGEPGTELTPTTSGWSGWVRDNFANVSDPANPSARLNIYSTDCYFWLVTPPIQIPAGAYQLCFDLALTKWSGANPVDPTQQLDDKFIVYISDNPNMIGATPLKTWDNDESPNVYNSISHTGESHILDLSSHAGTKYIAFYGQSTVSGGDNKLFVDNVQVREAPTAPVFSYTPESIDFGTTYANTPVVYQDVTVTNTGIGTLELIGDNVSIVGPDAVMFEFDPVNLDFALTTGQAGIIPVRYNPTAAGTHTATLRMVYDATNYNVALSGNALSEYAFIESFEGTQFPPEGWTLYNAGNGNNWYRDTSMPHTGSAHARIDYHDTIAHNAWLITPKLAPTADNYTFSFYGYTHGGYDERFNIKVSTTDTAIESFTHIIAENVGTGNPDYMLHTYSLSEFIGQQIYVAIQAISLDQWRLYIDDVSGPDMVPPPDIYAGEPYDAPNVDGAFFTSTHDLYKVPGFDGTTGPVADLNLDLETSHVAAYTAASGSFNMIFTVTLPGTYYLMAFYDGTWHHGNPWPQIIVNEAGDMRDIVLEGISFGAKGDVYIVLTRGNDPTVPVELSHFAATITAQNYVQITWTTQSESNISGYNIYRNANMDLSSAIKVSDLIDGTNTSEAHTYSYLDQELEQSGTYYYWLQNVELDGYTSFYGPVSVTFTADEEGGAPPVNFVTRLENAYPNPFNPNTNIRYQLKDAGDVKIDIFNARGQLVRSFSRSHDAAGYYQINWDGRDSSGKAVSSGVYQYKMTSGKYHSTKKMVLKK